MRKYKTVRGLLSDPKRWTKGVSRDMKPDGTMCFCLAGALTEVYGSDTAERGKACEKIRAAIRKLFPGLHTSNSDSIIFFNDAAKRRHQQIMKVLNAARV